MKLKRILSLTVCLLMVLALLVGCGKSSVTDNSASTAATSEATTAVTTTTQVETTLPAGKLSPEPVKLIFVKPLWGEMKPDADPVQRIRKVILEKTNVDVEIVTEMNPSDSSNKINLMIASGDPFDMLYDSATNLAGGKEVARLVKEDVLLPLDNLLQANAPDLVKTVDPTTWEYVKQDGIIYGLPGEAPKNQNSLLYRKDWLDADGLKVPATIEEWEKAAQDFKDKHKDPGFVQIWEGALQSSFIGSFVPSADGNFLDTDGKIKPQIMHKNFKDYLAKMQEWYKKGYIHKEIATMKMDQAFNLYTKAKIGLSHSWGDPAGFAFECKKVDPKAEYIWGPALNGLVEGSLTAYARIYDWAGVTKSCKHPDVAVRFLNWASTTHEGYELTMFGEEGIDWILNKRDGELVYYNSNDKLSKEKKYPTVYNCVPFSPFFTDYIVGTTSNSYYSDCNTYKLSDVPDLGLLYDNSIMKSKDKKADMDAYLLTEKYRIIMGQASVDNWNNVINTWLDKGGSTYIDDLTQQYNAWKAQKK